MVDSVGGLVDVSRASPRELAQVTGIGAARAAQIAAAFELGRRAVEAEHHRTTLGRPEDVFRLVAPRVAGLQQEVFLALGVDIRSGLLDVVEVARGTVNGVEVHPREVFRPLIRMAAAGAVLVHNHPSGDPTPSHEDVELTRRLRAVGEVLGIPVIDHVVVERAVVPVDRRMARSRALITRGSSCLLRARVHVIDHADDERGLDGLGQHEVDADGLGLVALGEHVRGQQDDHGVLRARSSRRSARAMS